MRSVFVFVVVLALAPSAFAQRDADGIGRVFDRFDRDGDGRITKDELPRQRAFDRLDADGNGVITREEAVRGADRAGRAGRDREQEADKVTLPMPPDVRTRAVLDVPYRKIEGVDPKRLSLDIYVPPTATPKQPGPVLVMIHGGGWRMGDKRNRLVHEIKRRHFCAAGYVLVSINYRLSTDDAKPPVRHPDHADDCAAAVAWVHANIARYGGDPDRLHLMGHSAGAHLAALIATDERHLARHDASPKIIRTMTLLDTASFDFERNVQLSPGGVLRSLYENAFGNDEAAWKDASPMTHVKPGKPMPRTLMLQSDQRRATRELGLAMADALNKADTPATAVLVPLDHGQINGNIGTVGDPMTDLVMRLHKGEDVRKFPDKLEYPPAKTGQTPDTDDGASKSR